MQTAPSTDDRNSNSSESANPAWNDFISSASPCSNATLGSHRVAGKRVLITGAGGSIGSALALAVHASAPANLVLLDASEAGLYQIDRRLHEAGSQHHVPILGSVTNGDQLSYLFEQHQPHIIFHAAALKHVPLMEQNPFAAIENNALGTLGIAQAASVHHVEQLVVVSTDKAVDPRSIMGASKRIAELILLSQQTSITRMTAVRLCNVIGSQGSVLPLFLDQIARGGPLTVTHVDAQRYFITLNQAVGALFAALQVQSSPALLIPDIGAPVSILALAAHLIEAHASSAAIEFTGLRPGDKLSEQLLSEREHYGITHNLDGASLHTIASPCPSIFTPPATLDELREAIISHDLYQLFHAVLTLVPEYEPSSVITTTLTSRSAMETATEVRA